MGFTKYAGAGFDSMQVSHRSSTGVLLGWDNLQVTTDNGESSSMRHLTGVVRTDPSTPEPALVTVPGDDGTIAQFSFDADGLPAWTYESSVNDLDFNAAIASVAKVTEANQVWLPYGMQGVTIPGLIGLVTRRTKGQDSGSLGAQGYEHLLLLNLEFQYLGNAYAHKGVENHRWKVIANYADTLPDGRAVSAVYPDVPGGKCIGFEFSSVNRVSYAALMGNNSLQAITLAHKPISTAYTLGTIETTGFAADTITAVGTTAPYTATLTGTPGAGKLGVVRYETVAFS